MTTEQTYAAPAVDTLREAEALKEAGVPEEHAAAMLYAAIRTSDARFAELRRDISRDIAALEARVDAKIESVNTKIDGQDAKLAALDARFDGQDAKFDAVNAKFDAVNDRIDGVDSKVSAMQWRLVAAVSVASVSLAVLVTSAPDIVAALR